ncbi:N-acetylmuramoyl-L-alanine amidase [Streptococcus sciuri]|uniref:N-acetylmuramoyl-L-alanine amidase n=1 Tax=Streptococcus sciuri TaxID=2973939 RepID=A0ABT2F535_9STRE|nr:N-acetylmuramoyl-L-alanine amidase [Streptococcus sciuri]MCS4487544.1 N-acetylmuramoyl-L-alanine amidase [Streptococcus sciuri]
MGKHLVICGHGQGRTVYDPGAVNTKLGITEAGKVRELAKLMSKYSGQTIDYITDQNVYDYKSLASLGKGYDSITELHFNSFNGTARGTEVLIQSSLTADKEDMAILSTLGRYFPNRGIKKVDWLYNANEAASRGYTYRLVEIAFIDNEEDMAIFESKKEEIAKGLVSAITQEEVKNIVSAPPSNQEGQPNSSTSPIYRVGDSVRVLPHATHYQTGQVISNWVRGKVYKILRVKEVKQSRSKRAYLLEGIQSWVLEQDVEGTSLGDSEQTYTAQKGDTYYGIARKFGQPVDALLALNGLKKTDILKIGQTLKVNAASRTTTAIPTSMPQRVIASALSKVGQKVTVPSNPYGGQCVALADKIVQELTDKNLSYTNAIDCLKKAKSNGFPVIYDAWGVNPKAGDFYVIDTVGHPFGHIGICVTDSDGQDIDGVEQNIDGYSDLNKNGINDQLELGGGGITRRVKRVWMADGSLYDSTGTVKLGKVIGWFRLG